MYFAGICGAVAFAVAMRNAVGEQNQMILSTTLVIAFITVLFFGGGAVPVLRFFQDQVRMRLSLYQYHHCGGGTWKTM